MQKKVLLSSILVIALCLSVIAGSTYALFTDKAETSIAITSGDVEVTANMVIDSLYSAEALPAGTTAASEYLIDEYSQHYAHVAQPGKFINGGTAVVDNAGHIVVKNITPGDKVVAKLVIENIGNVDMVYRYKINSADDLADVMVVTTDDGQARLALDNYTSDWYSNVVVAPGETAVLLLSFELPVYVGSAYENMDLTYDIVVEAVQGNANTNGLEELR